MDRISKIRFKNMLEKLINYCENCKGGKEKAILLRIVFIGINKIRLYSSDSSDIGQAVRDLNNKVAQNCNGSILVFWEEALDILYMYKEEFS